MDKIVAVYDSITGQTERFCNSLGIETVDILDYEPDDRDVLLATRSQDFGKVPDSTLEFLEDYANKVVGTVVSGNRNWGANYGMAGKVIEKDFNIPLILIFEGSGFKPDRETVKNWIIDRYAD